MSVLSAGLNLTMIVPVIMLHNSIIVSYNIQLALFLTHLIHMGQAPQYLSECICTLSAASGRYRLRSADSADYVLPRTRTKLAEHAFCYSAVAT